MNLTSNTRQNDSSDFFMVVPQIDRYRWLGGKSRAESAFLAKIRVNPIAPEWTPLPVSWVSGTEQRELSDFPIFHPIVRCMSKRALDVLGEALKDDVEFLPLNGVDGGYIGFHCTRWMEVSDLSSVPKNVSIHSTGFVPRFHKGKIVNSNAFADPRMVAKLFVSQRVKELVEDNNLSGLDFYNVSYEADSEI